MSEQLSIEGAKLIFKNFRGMPDKYHAKGGVRQFSILLDEAQAEDFDKRGLNVKLLKSSDPDEEPHYHVRVKVNYDGRTPPNVVLIAAGMKQPLTVDTIGILDTSLIINADLTISLWDWDINGRQGTSLYLKTLFAEIQLDPIEMKYANTNSEQLALEMAPDDFTD